MNDATTCRMTCQKNVKCDKAKEFFLWLLQQQNDTILYDPKISSHVVEELEQ